MDLSRASWTSDANGNVFGRTLFERVALSSRAQWASSVLATLYPLAAIRPEIDLVLEIGAHAERWGEAHDAFDALRDCNLTLPATQPAEVLQHAVLDVAETVAKIIYNASGRPAPFDANAGWLLAPRACRVVTLADNAPTGDRVWAALTQFRARAT